MLDERLIPTGWTAKPSLSLVQSDITSWSLTLISTQAVNTLHPPGVLLTDGLSASDSGLFFDFNAGGILRFSNVTPGQLTELAFGSVGLSQTPLAFAIAFCSRCLAFPTRGECPNSDRPRGARPHRRRRPVGANPDRTFGLGYAMRRQLAPS